MKTQSMYESLMGASFHRLSAPVQAFHRLTGSHVLQGWVQTEAPQTFVARLLARCLGAPLLASAGVICLELVAHPDQEVWIRHFPANTMISRMRLGHNALTERLGPICLHFCLEEVNGRLVMRLTKLTFLILTCPRWAMPDIIAEEDGYADQMRFNVRVSLPLIGQIAGYSGYLVVDLGNTG